jgi:hypothetical protein
MWVLSVTFVRYYSTLKYSVTSCFTRLPHSTILPYPILHNFSKISLTCSVYIMQCIMSNRLSTSSRSLKTITPTISAHDHVLSAKITPVLSHMLPTSRRILIAKTLLISAYDRILSATISPVCPHHAVYCQQQLHLYYYLMTIHYQQRNYLLSVGLQLIVYDLRSATVLSVMWHIFITMLRFLSPRSQQHLTFTIHIGPYFCNVIYVCIYFCGVLSRVFCLCCFVPLLPVNCRPRTAIPLGHHHGVIHRAAWSSPEPVIRSASCHKFMPRFDAAHCTSPPDAVTCLSYACRFTDVSFLQPFTETAYHKIQTSRANTRHTRIGPLIHSHWCSKNVKIAIMKNFIFLFVYTNNQVARSQDIWGIVKLFVWFWTICLQLI